MIKKISTWQLMVLLALSVLTACNSSPGNFQQSGEELEICPDYSSVILPPNIAPVNFRIMNQGEAFKVEISNSKNRTIRIRSRKPNIKIPVKAWKQLLQEDKGGTITISISRKTEKKSWETFAAVQNEIAKEEIDPFIAFRKIPAANIRWREMGIFQRSVENFNEYPVMVNRLTDHNCMNCHSFNVGDPGQMVLHMRGEYGGTLVLNEESIQFVNTKSDHTRSAGVYPSWHPNGKLVAFSVNMINQWFHSRMGKIALVLDRYSDIVLYDVENNSITRPAELASDKLENLPAWSKDGNTLYYICAEQNTDTVPYDAILYNLMSIGFDEETGKFGSVDTLINSRVFGKSISFPRESTSSGIISFIGLDYGYFSIYNREADVYFYHSASGEISRPEVNSEFTESYPSWSSNGSWLMFVSKRDDGIHSQVWFSHVDINGNAGKPFVLPQRDPDFYDDYLYNYNRPEFITGKVKMNPRRMFNIVKRGAVLSGFNEAESVSLSSGATAPAAWQESEFYHHE